MRLYECPRDVWIDVVGTPVWFCHIDGMYSVCLTERGELTHLYAMQDVTIIDTDEPKPTPSPTKERE